MKRHTITLASMALASLAACTKHESHAAAKPVAPAPVTVPEHAPVPTPAINPTPTPETSASTTPTTEKLADRAQELYNEAVDTTQAKLRDARESFVEIERKIDEKGDQAPQTWHDIRTNLRTKLDAADAKYDTWRAAASEQWDNFKSEMSKMVDDISNSLDDAKKKILG